jgi:glycosyltransferase involved in cell wall biosynthesis
VIAPASPAGTTALIAVCLCTYNRPSSLERTLRAIRSAEPVDAETRIEVVVVDNAVEEQARRVADEARSYLRIPLHFAQEPERGISFARNRAIAEALRLDADFVAFLDDDDAPRPDWLRRLVDAQRAAGADLVFGKWEPIREKVPELTLKAGKLLEKSVKPEGFVDRLGLPQDASTCNVLISRRIIDRMRVENELFSADFALAFGGDHDFFIRCIRHGASFVRCPESVVDGEWASSRMTVRGMIKRSFAVGVKQAMLDDRYLPAPDAARRRRESLGRLPRALARTVWRTLAGGGPKALGAASDCATLAGRIFIHLGFRYRYYR